MPQALVGDVRVLVIGRRPSVEDFDAHIRETVALDDAVRVVLLEVLDEHAVLNAKERAKLRDAGLLKKPHAIIARLSPMARSIMAALGWLGATVRGFAPEDREQAYEFLGIGADQRTEVEEQLALLKQRVSATGAPDPMDDGKLTSMAVRLESTVAIRVAKIQKRAGDGRA
jgi:hypothetical protein